MQRRENRPQGFVRDPVVLDPLREEPLRPQMQPHLAIEVGGEEIGDPRHPRVRRLRGDDVVPLGLSSRWRRPSSTTRRHRGSESGPPVDRLEVGRGVDHRGLELDHVDRANHPVRQRRADRHAAAVPDHEHLLGRGCAEDRQRPEEQLGGGVAAAGARVRLSAHIERRAAFHAKDRDRGVAPSRVKRSVPGVVRSAAAPSSVTVLR